MLFAHLKRIMKLDRLRLRGLTGATDEFTLAAMVQNLRRMRFLPQGPPLTRIGMPATSRNLKLTLKLSKRTLGETPEGN
ncbi:hypothetical protein [Enterobacter hormaechei]|uniref:hypothetical protein n=1 Tax=Enterobacter hormaechei TaxID=158836 RepID=UPI0034DD8BB0